MASRKAPDVRSKSYYGCLKKFILCEDIQLVRPMLNLYVKEYGMFASRVMNMVSLYLCKKDPSKAIAFLHERGLERLSCNVSTEVVKSLVKVGRSLDANKFILEAGEKRSSLDVFVYSIVVDGLCKEGHLEKALELCACMKQSGILPNIVTYNAVINGLCKQGCLTEAFRLFNSMELVNIPPTIITYGTLISCLCGEGFLQDAMKLFERMLCSGITPNTHIYNSLIYGHSRFGLMDECQKILFDMEMGCLQPDHFTISAVLSGFCVKGDMGGALQFYYRYQKKANSPDFFGFYCLIKGLYSKGRMEETRTILRDMLQCEPVVHFINQAGDVIDVESLASSLSTLCQEGNIHDAISLLSEIGYVSFPAERSDGFNKDSHIRKLQDMKSLTDNSGKLTSTTKCLGLHQEEKKHVSCSSATLQNNACLNFVTEVSTNDKVVADNDMSSLPADFNTYYSIISSLCLKGQFYEANNLAKTMLLSQTTRNR